MRAKAAALFKDTLYRNSIYLILTTGTMAGFGFIFWLIVAHLYMPTQVGIAATLISCMNFIAYLSLLGFNSTFVRFLPKSSRRNEQIDTGLVLVTLAAIIVAGLFVLIAPHFAPKLSVLQQNPLYGLGFIALCVGAGVNLVTDSIFVAYRSAGYNLLVDGLLGSCTEVLLPLALISLGAYGIFMAQGMAAFVAMTMSIVFLIYKFNYRPAFKINRNILRKVVTYSFGNYAGNLLSILPTLIVPIIILNKLGSAPAGYYYLAYMLANLLFTIAYAVTQSFFAEGSYNDQKLGRLVKRTSLLLSALIIPAAIILAAIGPFILDIFGRTYGLHSHKLIILLAAAGPFTAICAVGTVTLRITKHVNSIVLVNLVNVLIICGLSEAWARRGLSWIGGAWLVGQSLSALMIMALIGWLHSLGKLSAPDRPA